MYSKSPLPTSSVVLSRTNFDRSWAYMSVKKHCSYFTYFDLKVTSTCGCFETIGIPPNVFHVFFSNIFSYLAFFVIYFSNRKWIIWPQAIHPTSSTKFIVTFFLKITVQFYYLTLKQKTLVNPLIKPNRGLWSIYGANSELEWSAYFRTDLALWK